MLDTDRARVLRMIARLNVGGPAIQTVNLTWRLQQHGYDSVLLRGQEGADEGNMDHLADAASIRPVRLPGLQREIGRHDLRAVWETMGWLHRFRPLVLHTHTAKAGAVGRIAAALLPAGRPPVIVHTFHGHVFKGEFSERKSLGFVRMERELARVSTRLIAVSEEVKQDLVELRVAPAEKVEVVHLGFDLAPFTRVASLEREHTRHEVRRRHGIPNDARVVSVVARVVQVKRIDRFLTMARRLADDVHFLIVGDGDRRRELEQSEDARTLGDRLHWVGFQRDIPSYCFASDVVALSSDNEGTPVCLIEAQASGLPVVSTRVGGVETVVKDGVSGYVVDEDALDLAKAVQRLLDDPDRCAAFGAAGRARALSTFSVERLVADIDGLYRRLLSERGIRVPGSRAVRPSSAVP